MPETQPGKEMRQRILEAIRVIWETKGYSPSVRELAEEIQIGTHTCHYHLIVLERQGLIAFEPRLSRTLRVLK